MRFEDSTVARSGFAVSAFSQAAEGLELAEGIHS
jgi:hypothetical protein